MSNDYFKAQGWFKNYALNSQDSRGMFQRLVKEDEEAFRLASAETDKIKAMMNKKYGPGSMKYDSEISQPPTRPDVIEIDAINSFVRRNPAAEGGRQGFDNGLSAKQKKALTITYPKDSTKDLEIKKTNVEQAKELGVSKSALKKPYAPEIEARIIELHQNDKLGAEAIAKKLREEFDGVFGRSSVGKRIAALRKEGIIKDVPYKERKASIDQRGEFYKKPAGDKYLAIREVRDIDRTTRFKDTGELKYNIPEDAKFKIDFKNPGVSGAAVSDIPEDLRGIQYYKTKKDAENALKKRKALKLRADIDLDEARRSANKKKYDLVKEVSNNNIEELLTDFKKGQPLEQAHRLSLNQVKKTGELYNVMNLGLDFDDPNFVQINNEFVKPYENKLKQLYKEQDQLYKKASKLETIPKELQKQIELNNKKISTVVDLSGGRVQGLQLDELTLKPKTYGTNYANVLGFGMYDKPVKDLTKIDRAEIGLIMQGQIENEKKTAGATAKKLFANTELLNNVDELTVPNQTKKNIDYIGGKKDFVGFSSGFNTDLLMKDPAVQKLLNSKAGQAVKNAARGTAGTVGKVFGVADILIGALDYENNISKGQTEKEALGNAVQAMSFGLYKSGDRARIADVKERFVAKGGDGEIFDQATALNAKDQEINDLIYKSKFTADKAAMDLGQPQAILGKSLDQRKQDYELLKKSLNEKIRDAIEERDNMIKSYKTNLQVSEAGAPINIGGQEFFSQPFKDIKSATMDKITDENRKAYDMQKRQLNFTSGNIGNFLQNQIFTMNPQEQAQMQKYINEMDERELYKFNLERGMDPDNLIRFEDILNYKMTSPELMGVNTTKYINKRDQKSEGGITGLRSKYEYKK